MPRVRATKELRYGGQTRMPGTESAEFDCNEREAFLLNRIGKVEYVVAGPTEKMLSSDIKVQATANPSTTPPPPDAHKPPETVQQPPEKPTEDVAPAKVELTVEDKEDKEKGEYQTRDMQAESRPRRQRK